jgi:ketosteroid isomerase-like protein
MSQENLEIVRRSFEAFNRGDLDAAFEDFAPDFELDFSRSISIARGTYNLAQFRRLNESFAEIWESNRLVADELIDAGELVVVPFTSLMRLMGSGEPWGTPPRAWGAPALGAMRIGSRSSSCLVMTD